MTELPRERGDVSIADAVSAASRLDLSGQDLATLTEMLGLWISPDVPQGRQAIAKPHIDTIDEPSATPIAAPTDDASGMPDLQPPNSRRRRTTMTILNADESFGLESSTDGPLVVSFGSGLPTLPYRPPIPHMQLRVALASLIRRPRRGHRPDQAALVRTVAERRPVHDLPKEPEESLIGGVVVLADVGELMAPYLADVAHLVEQVRHVVGASNTLVYRLRDNVLGWLESNISIVRSARPVVLISVLGRLDAAPISANDFDWADVPNMLAANGIDTIALVPHRSTSGQKLVRSRIVAWDDLPVAGRGRI
jgi:hypothetical protein